MTTQTSWFLCRVAGACLLSLGVFIACAVAQEEPAEPAAEPATPKVQPAKPAAPPAQAAPAPAGQVPAAAEGQAPAAEQPAEPAPPETDPLVLAVLEVKPATPEQWLRDIRALIQLSRPALAKEYLAQFAAALPPPADLARLQARFGSAFFLELSSLEAVQPEGALVANAVMQAADERLRNTERLAGLVDRLDDADAATRRLAMADLVEAGPVAIPALLRSLADPAQSAGHDAIRRTFVALGPSAVRPLTAALRATDPGLQGAVLQVLGDMKARTAIPYLFAPALSADTDSAVREAAQQALQQILGDVPTQGEAIRYLTDRIEALSRGAAPAAVDESGNAALWMWDAAQQAPVLRTWPQADASFVVAAELAHQRYLVDPSSPAHRRAYFVTALETLKRQEGYDRSVPADAHPVVAELAQAGVAEQEAVLVRALEDRLDGTAIAVLELLGETRDATLVTSVDGQPRVLVRALQHPHRRVQCAAARAIVKCAPTKPYPGSSYLPNVLGFLATSAGHPHVLVGEPRAATAQVLAGLLNDVGYEAQTAPLGRAFLLRAFDSPDFMFLLIGDAIDHPTYSELVQVLRRDSRTADLPVGIMAREHNTEAARRLAASDPLTVVLAPPQTRDDMAADAQRLLAAAGRQLVPAEERLRAANFALDALATFVEHPEQYGFYDVMQLEPRMEEALRTPELAVPASRLLGLLGSPAAQQALVEFASASMQPLDHRQAAVAALRVAVQRRGLRLTRDQLLRQYDLYNASQHLDPETQAVLASILDTVEAPARQPDSSSQDK